MIMETFSAKHGVGHQDLSRAETNFSVQQGSLFRVSPLLRTLTTTLTRFSQGTLWGLDQGGGQA